MKKYMFLFLLFLFIIDSYGQNDSIQNEILHFSDSKSEIISKGRLLLLDKFLEGDIIKIQEIKKYLITNVENQDYAVFFPVEYWLILYWTKEYHDLITSLNNFDSVALSQFKRKIKPQYDLLFEKLLSKSRDSNPEMEISINNSALQSVEKDFLSICLKYFITDDTYPKITQDTLNALADDFLAAYPHSDYETFIRKNIRYKFIPSKWGIAAEFFSGYGFFTGELETNYKNNVPIGVAFDIYYRNFALYLRDYIGFSKTNKDIPYENGIWTKGSQVRVFLPEASLGYVVLDKKFVKIAPFAGIASTDIGPTQVDVNNVSGLTEVELEFTTTYTAGLNIDFKLGLSNATMFSHGPEQSYWFLRLRYAYNMPQFERKYDGINGNIHCITIGIGGFGRKLKRDY